MGIYNCASTLQESLDSLYSQTFQNFEIIMCDDGSIDNTYQIAENNAKNHSNIVLLKNDQNLGLASSLNKCLETAKGKYIARMDADDISLPDRFEKEYDFLESNKDYAMVSSNMIHFDESGEFARSRKKEKEVLKRDFLAGNPFSHPACMVRKDVYNELGGYTIANWLKRCEDYHLWYKMYLQGYKGYNLSDCLLMFRDDKNALARRKLKNRIYVARLKYYIVRDFRLGPLNYIYCLKPIVVGLLPKRLYSYLHRKM